MTPDHATLCAATQATWPPAQVFQHGPFTVRDGAGGGKRVSAATLSGEFSPNELFAAEEAMRDVGQTPMFQVLPGQDQLDQALATAEYEVVDPTIFYVAPVEPLTNPDLHRLAAIPSPEPLAIQAEIWAEGGIGPARLNVMSRVQGKKTYLMGRCDDRPAAAAFVASAGAVAMLHALEVRPHLRRKGAGLKMMQGAANWAQTHGAETLSLLVVRANVAANALYTSLGMTPVEGYHYRVKGKG